MIKEDALYKIEELSKSDKQILIDYMLMKIKHEDWHAVSDAANDLREIEASNEGKNTKITI